MGPYSFTQEMQNLRMYYGMVSSSLSASASISSNQASSTAGLTADPQLVLYLRQSIPIMFCMVWERFIRELEINDIAKYRVCFQDRTERPLRKFYNKAIQEIFLIRNCIVHNMSRANRDYVNEFPGRYIIDQPITEIDSPEIDRQLTIFLDAFNKISTSDISLLP